MCLIIARLTFNNLCVTIWTFGLSDLNPTSFWSVSPYSLTTKSFCILCCRDFFSTADLFSVLTRHRYSSPSSSSLLQWSSSPHLFLKDSLLNSITISAILLSPYALSSPFLWVLPLQSLVLLLLSSKSSQLLFLWIFHVFKTIKKHLQLVCNGMLWSQNKGNPFTILLVLS